MKNKDGNLTVEVCSYDEDTIGGGLVDAHLAVRTDSDGTMAGSFNTAIIWARFARDAQDGMPRHIRGLKIDRKRLIRDVFGKSKLPNIVCTLYGVPVWTTGDQLLGWFRVSFDVVSWSSGRPHVCITIKCPMCGTDRFLGYLPRHMGSHKVQKVR